MYIVILFIVLFKAEFFLYTKSCTCEGCHSQLQSVSFFPQSSHIFVNKRENPHENHLLSWQKLINWFGSNIISHYYKYICFTFGAMFRMKILFGFNNHLNFGFLQNKHYCIISLKKIPRVSNWCIMTEMCLYQIYCFPKFWSSDTCSFSIWITNYL